MGGQMGRGGRRSEAVAWDRGLEGGGRVQGDACRCRCSKRIILTAVVRRPGPIFSFPLAPVHCAHFAMRECHT